MSSDRERGEEGLAVRLQRALDRRELRAKGGAAPLVVELDRFEIVAFVGGGGMGRVFAARDPALGRRVAIKICRLVSPDTKTLLEREARILARLSHPNIVAVHEVIEIEGELAIVMEYIEGRTLREWAADESPTWREILVRFDAAGRALEAVHAAKLEHGDFKPDNVMIDREGRIRVVDFGVARSQRTESSEGGGTLLYMPPEQLLGHVVTARADVFGFCLSIWELVFRARPFGVRELLGTSDPVALTEFRAPAHVPPELVDVLRRGLAWDPRKRWRSIAEVRAALDEVVGGDELRRAKRQRRATIGAMAGLATAVVGLALTLAWQQPPAAATGSVATPQQTGPVTVEQFLALAQQEASAIDGDPDEALLLLERARSRALKAFDEDRLRLVAEQALTVGDALAERGRLDHAAEGWTLAADIFTALGDHTRRRQVEVHAARIEAITRGRGRNK